MTWVEVGGKEGPRGSASHVRFQGGTEAVVLALG